MNRSYYVFYFIFFCASVFTIQANAQVYNGDLTVTTQAEIDTFSYSEVTGNLIINDSPESTITNLNGMSVLTKVGKGLLITENIALTDITGLGNLNSVNSIEITKTGLTNLDGLSGITILGQDSSIITLTISNNPEIRNINGLSNLKSIKGLTQIEYNAKLENLDGFSSLTTAGILVIGSTGITSVSGLSKVTSVGDVYIRSNQNLTNLNGLFNIDSLRSTFWFSSNDALTNTNGLLTIRAITDSGGIGFQLNNALSNINGLSNIEKIDGSLYIVSRNLLNINGLKKLKGGNGGIVINGERLNDLSGLSNLVSIKQLAFNSILVSNLGDLKSLKTVGRLEIYNMPNLVDIKALGTLSSLTELTLQGNSELQNLYGLENLLNINSELIIAGNNKLINLEGLNNLKNVGSIYINNNSNLINIDALRSITCVEHGIKIERNPALKNVDGLSGLEGHKEGIYIEENNNLESLKGLSKITSLLELSILRNNALLNIDGIENIAKVNRLVIYGNLALQDVNGLSGLTEGIVIIGANQSLSKFCGLYNYFSMNLNPDYQIYQNAVNPTPEEIVSAGPCTPIAPMERSYTSVLQGKNELPPVTTDGTGGGMFILNAAMDTLHYWIRLAGLSTALSDVKFYYGRYWEKGTAIKTITSEVISDSNGSFAHGVWTKYDLSEPLTPAYIGKLVIGELFINVLTTGNPTGEIRGELTDTIPTRLYANLDGSQEVPPVDPAGSGEAWFTLSGDGDSLYYNVTAYDLTSPVTAAHFHKAPIDSAGPPVKPISFVGDTLSEGWWTNMDATPLTPELVADLLGCYIYVNVHTSNNPNGEIRGQLYKTDEVQQNFMTLLAAENDADENNYSKLSYYTLQEGKPFHNYEGDITGYDGQKNIVDMTIDIGGNVYLLNNSWTSMLYRIRPEQFDFNEETVLKAKQIGRLRTSPDDTYKWMTNIQFIKGKLYGFDNKTNKLYNINPNNAHVTEIAELSSIGTGTAGFALGADGNVYLLKNIDEKRSEIWKFNKFPSAELTLVTEVPSLGRLNTLSAHPNGNLYATCSENLYEINLSNQTIGVLKNHKVTASAMDFDFFTEKQTAATGTIGFTNLDGVTAVGDFTEIPAKFELSQNYPNPFNPSTTIKYALPEASFVKLVVYNSLGEVVKTLINDNRGAGYYETVFDAKDLSSGMYIYRLEAGSFVSTAKMILIK